MIKFFAFHYDIQFITHVEHLQFDCRPDYRLLIDLMKKAANQFPPSTDEKAFHHRYQRDPANNRRSSILFLFH